MANEKYDYDLFVIGAGSGGTRAARVAAGYGARVAVAEEFRVGGTCVIRGCVPKKLLVYGAHFAEDLQDAARFGWQVPKSYQFNWPSLRDNVLEEVKRISAAYSRTLESNSVHVIHQRAIVSGPNQVTLADGQVRTAAKVLIAVGARPFVPQFPGAEHGITSNDAFHLTALPKRVLIAGAGYIANEFASIFDRFGVHVTMMNRTAVILRGYDESICDRLLQISQKRGIEFRFHTTFKAIERNQDGSLTVSMTNYDSLTVDMVMFATGRVPNTDGLGLEEVGVELDKNGAVIVDDYNKSTCDTIYAVGDVTNRIQLTPVAIREGQAFADAAFGRERVRVAYENVPSAVFTQPPIASVGVTEAVARAKFRSVKVYTADFLPMKNALAGREERALYKMVCDGETDQVVGLHMIGPDSPEILQAAAIAVRAGLTKAVFDQTVALHPTMAEELVLMK